MLKFYVDLSFLQYRNVKLYIKKKWKEIGIIALTIFIIVGSKLLIKQKEKKQKIVFTERLIKINNNFSKKRYKELLNDMDIKSFQRNLNTQQYVILLNTKYSLLSLILQSVLKDEWHYLVKNGSWVKLKKIVLVNKEKVLQKFKNENYELALEIIDELNKVYEEVMNKNTYISPFFIEKFNIHGEYLNTQIFLHIIKNENPEKVLEFFSKAMLASSIFRDYIFFVLGVIRSENNDGSYYLQEILENIIMLQGIGFDKNGIPGESKNGMIDIFLMLQAVNKR